MFTPHNRVERAIAVARLVLAAFTSLALWIDPLDPPADTVATSSLMLVYGIYALVWILLIRVAELAAVRFRLLSHIVDLTILYVFVCLTGSLSTTLFFAYFVFGLLCGILRWQWRGAAWTGGAIFGAAFIGLRAHEWLVIASPDLELNRLLIRMLFLGIVGGLLSYLGMHELRLRREMCKLAASPRIESQDLGGAVATVLEYAADILGAPRVLLAWQEQDQPSLQLAMWSKGAFHRFHEAPTRFGGLVAEELQDADFFCSDAADANAKTVRHSARGLSRRCLAAIVPELRAHFSMRAVLSTRLAGGLHGRLFVLDKRRITSDDLMIGQIVARQIESCLALWFLQDRLRRMAATEARLRVARDLHDGVLQSLTGVALELEMLRTSSDRAVEAIHSRLQDLQGIVVGEHNGLRSYIGRLRPFSGAPHSRLERFPLQLEALAERIERQWGMTVTLRVEGACETLLPVPLQSEVYLIAREALVNAARHAQSSSADLTIEVKDGMVHIIVADKGRGFPFQGRYNEVGLDVMGMGPLTLMERVNALGGRLDIDSSRAGARLDIRLPLFPRAA